MFAISGIPLFDLVILTSLEDRGNYLKNSLDIVDGATPVSLLRILHAENQLILLRIQMKFFKNIKLFVY